MKKILPFCLLAIGFGFAQEPVSSPPPPAPEASSTGSAFDAVRGFAYNPHGIAGAPSSVNDLVLTPSDIYGKRFFYVSPTERRGYVAFNSLGGSTLLGMTPNGDLVLGHATPGFGLALEYTVRKTWTKETIDNNPEPGSTTISERVTSAGDNIALYLSLPLGSATAYANLGWYTNGSYYTETEGAPTPAPPGESKNGYEKFDNSTINARVGVLGEAGNLNYDASLNIFRAGGTLTSDLPGFSSMGEKVVTRDSRLGVNLNFDLSYAVLKNETARILIGANNELGVRFYDAVDPDDESNGYGSGKRTEFTISPTILGEVILAEHWLAFAGAQHDINFRFGSEDYDVLRITDYSETEISQSRTDAYIGIRYHRDNWAFEAQVQDNVFSNPFGGFNGSSIFARFGGFIYF